MQRLVNLILLMENNSLKKDIKNFLITYPKFTFEERVKKQYSVLFGEIDICDINGNYWNSYDIEIYIDSRKYPYCIPIITETSNKIIRNIDWHIDKEGVCCIEIEHELEYLAKRGIEIKNFYQHKVYPYFVNTTYKKQNGDYAGDEYQHNFDGVIQFYKERLNLLSIPTIIKILNAIISKGVPGRNDPCICGMKKKIKDCHLPSIEFLKSLSKNRLVNDLKKFKNL